MNAIYSAPRVIRMLRRFSLAGLLLLLTLTAGVWAAGPNASETGWTNGVRVTSDEASMSVTSSELTPTVVCFQQGSAGYAGNADVHLDLMHPNTNYGNHGSLYAKTQDNATILTRFDLSSLPINAQIIQATLRLRLQNTYPVGAAIGLEAYRVLRTWEEDQATWNHTRLGEFWYGAGVNGAGIDRLATAEQPLLCYDPAKDADGWVELDVTDSVQQWVARPQSNYGVVIKAYRCREGTVLYAFSSSESLGIHNHPQLCVSYIVPPPPTPTPTALPPTPTPTPTATPSTGAIAGYVWHDFNGDGLRDEGEPGLPGAMVTLRDRFDNLLQSWTTGANGWYQFSGLLPDVYWVGLTCPPGFLATTPSSLWVMVTANSTIPLDFGARSARLSE